MKYSFRNDYSDGGHPAVIEALSREAAVMADGYGDDIFCTEASAMLKQQMDNNDVDIHFLAGGTLTNLTAISAFLRPHEAVISTREGHIYTHETGSVEATGHKVIPVDTTDGKITPQQIKKVVDEHYFEHMVKPALVYISQPTEMGTVYSKDELEALRASCDSMDLVLYADGARLGSAIVSHGGNPGLAYYSRVFDSFYIGGTKNGALFGEALVISNDELKKDFRYHMKQKGALMAKGRSLGIQFKALFTDDLYFKLAARANELGAKLQDGIKSAGFKMMFNSSTNQIFPIFPEEIITELEKKYLFYRWEALENGESSVRLVCSWATDEDQVDGFIRKLKES